MRYANNNNNETNCAEKLKWDENLGDHGIKKMRLTSWRYVNQNFNEQILRKILEIKLQS